jgi:hypothetical protein
LAYRFSLILHQNKFIQFPSSINKNAALTKTKPIYRDFKDDQYELTTATTIEEAKQVLSAGFDYVAEKSGIMPFRRPKRFSKCV